MIISESCIKKEEKFTIILSYLPKNEFICLILMQNEADKSKMRQKNLLCHKIPNVLDCFITFSCF